MRLTAGLALCLSLSALAAAQPPKKKLPAPKLVEEDGKKVLVFEYGKTDGTVKVGELRYKLIPLHGDNGQDFRAGYEVTNLGNNSVKGKDVMPTPREGSITAADTTGRKFRATFLTSGSGPLDPEKSASFMGEFSPLPNKSATAVVVTLPAPPGTGADEWRVTYPKKTWTRNR